MKKIFVLGAMAFVSLLTVCRAQEIPTIHKAWKLDGAQERIEKYRKGDAKVIFKLNGKPVSNAKVNVGLASHDFYFGSALRRSSFFKDEAQKKAYMDCFKDVCNFATIQFYWSTVEKKKGVVDCDHVEESLRWAAENKLTLKGHPLMWHNTVPKWLEKEPVEEVDRLIHERIAKLLADFPEIRIWDTYNEAVAAPEKHVKHNRVVDWILSHCDEGCYGLTDSGEKVAVHQNCVNKATAELHRYCRSIAPDVKLINNHYSYRSPANRLTKVAKFFDQNKYFMENDVPFDYVGIQTHMQKEMELMTEEEMWAMMEQYSQFGRPIHFTEISIPSYKPFESHKAMQDHLDAVERAKKNHTEVPFLRPTPEWSEFQADYLRDFYTLAFSHPNVEALTYWSFTDKNGWRNISCGLLDENMKPKPAYDVLHDLIHREWHTDVQAKTSKEGTLEFNGFYGRYEGTVLYKGKEYRFEFGHHKDVSEPVVVELPAL